MLFYKRHVGACFFIVILVHVILLMSFGASYFKNVILVHVILLLLFWCILFYKRHFDACYFIHVILVHVILQMTFQKLLPQNTHFKNSSLKNCISKIPPLKNKL